MLWRQGATYHGTKPSDLNTHHRWSAADRQHSNYPPLIYTQAPWPCTQQPAIKLYSDKHTVNILIFFPLRSILILFSLLNPGLRAYQMSSSCPTSTVYVFSNAYYVSCPTNYFYFITMMIFCEAHTSYNPTPVTSSVLYLSIALSSSSVIRYLILIFPLGRDIISRDWRKLQQLNLNLSQRFIRIKVRQSRYRPGVAQRVPGS